MKIVITIVLMTISYFIGNTSPATLLARAAGKDIKKEGSGNAGATNVLRVLGPKAAVITLIIDVLKGFIATKGGYIIALAFANKMLDPVFNSPTAFAASASAWCGLAVFIGHIWPLVFKFKGGKGVATALGVLLATDIKVALVCLGIFAIILIASRMVSLGSICAAAAFPFIYVLKLIFSEDSTYIKSTFMLSLYLIIPVLFPLVIMAVILIIKHKENIKRIIRGEESKLVFKKEEPPVK